MIQEVCDSLTSRLSVRPEAIVLTGSFARDEGSVLMAGERLRVLGDMEYMVIYPIAAGLQCGFLSLLVGAFFLSAEFVKLFWLLVFICIPREQFAGQRAAMRIRESALQNPLGLKKSLRSFSESAVK